MIMPIDSIPDWEMRLARQDAFWDRAIIDRPMVSITVPRHENRLSAPESRIYDSERERWFDAQYVAECALVAVENTIYLGDALPNAWPNLGPEIFSACLGCELEYTTDTAWAQPLDKDWADLEALRIDTDSIYWRKTWEMTQAYLDAGRGKFYTAMTDLHAGGDALASLREPQQLCMDLLESPDEVKRLLHSITDEYLKVFDLLHDQLTTAGQPSGCNAFGIISRRNWAMVCNDFSYMISKRLFDDIFLPEIVRECRHMEATCYHLDGIGALRHLDSLLDVPEITVIQWVPGRGSLAEWLNVYQRCQAAGKGIQIWALPDEVDILTEHLHPEGVWLSIPGVATIDEADTILHRLTTWR